MDRQVPEQNNSSPNLAAPAEWNVANGDRLLKLPEVMALTRRSRTAVFALRRNPGFPRPLRVAPNAIGWRLSEIKSWVGAQPITSAERT